MKMKAVCEATGLTRKTILFYEDQGFILPQKTRMNQRDYRDYTDADIQTLNDIAALRKCGFSIDEIKKMRSSPETVRPIFQEYRLRLFSQKTELEELIHTAGKILEDDLCDVQSLLEQIRSVSNRLPLPEYDLTPHFLHMDEMEAEITPIKKARKFHVDIQPVTIDQDHILMDSRYGKKKLLDELKNDFEEVPYYDIPDSPESPIWLSVLKVLIVLALILVSLNYIQATRWGLFSEPAVINMAILVVLIVLLIAISLLQNRFKKK